MAILRPAEQAVTVKPVLNLSQGGMLVAETELDPGQRIEFELAGRNFCYGGTAVVVHHTAGRSGVRFVNWRGPVERPLRQLIAERLPRLRLRESGVRDQPLIHRVANLIAGRPRRF